MERAVTGLGQGVSRHGAAAALVQRRYNPGLVTAVGVFLPLSAVSLGVFAAVPGVGVAVHAMGLLVAVAVHVAIIVHRRRPLAALA